MKDEGSREGTEWGRVERDRIAKIDALRELGISPYAYSYDPTHSASTAASLLTADL